MILGVNAFVRGSGNCGPPFSLAFLQKGRAPRRGIGQQLGKEPTVDEPGDRCTGEGGNGGRKVIVFLIKTRKQRGLLLERLRDPTRLQRL